jgi:adenosylcobinamide kinase/adenosylcobinamide-phosphate guanylyltransferase
MVMGAITLVLGGARSGKSQLAERIASRLPLPVTYIATASVDYSDAEHAARIATHRARRDPRWSTVESGADLTARLLEITGSVIVDSLGTWVTAHDDFAVDVGSLCTALRTRQGDTVIVSEEVGLGVHPSSDAGRRFRDVVGVVNTAVAGVADDVFLVVAGRVLPLEQFS